MPAVDPIRVEGLRELNKAFRLASRELSKELRDSLRVAVEPVEIGAESLALTRIRRIGPKWWDMRIGVTRTLVYVAPKQRGRFTKRNPRRYARPNLSGLLLEKAMEPALNANIANITARVDDMLQHVGRDWERV